MRVFKGRLLAVLFAALTLLPGERAQAELIATAGETKLVELSPLENGTSALTLVWTIDHPTLDRTAAMSAAIASVVTGGTSTRSSYEVSSFLKLKGVEQKIGRSGKNLTLTVSAPSDVFPEVLVHLENVLLEPRYTPDWYARELEASRPVISTRTRQPSDVLNEITNYLEFDPAATDEETLETDFQFGRPAQVILRSEDEEVMRRTVRLINSLPGARFRLGRTLSKWAEGWTGANGAPFALPKGIVHFADPDASEMLILFVNAKTFSNAQDQLGSNLLVDYIGANQGSEMFRVIRQSMRASYDPRSDFVVVGKNKAVIALSATVEASAWPEVHGKIMEIYQGVRDGGVVPESLEIQKDRLDRTYYHRFFTDPDWGARQFLDEHPDGVEGEITLPLFEAFRAVSTEETIENADTLLPPVEEFLVILIGGGVSPSADMRSDGYCALPKGAPISRCLNKLSNAEY
ncbi:hypothetical protein [Ruegeria arenilitoris]|uniref:hypothetical protein n=1 Tax=Ruegeria arenilitoris TaxID=1173585 RepID=UPI00147F992A|nr:hypothetical protein [Ruegeria arenilitoris]